MWLRQKEDQHLLAATLAVIGLLYIAIRLAFSFQEKQRSADPWELIPESSVIVAESDNLNGFCSSLDTLSVWQSLSQIPLAASIQDEIIQLCSVFPHQVAEGKAYLTVSTEGVKPYAFSVILPINQSETTTYADTLAAHFQVKLKQTPTKREYRKHTIWEVPMSKGRKLVFARVKDHLIGSWDGVMVESAIRQEAKLYPDAHRLKKYTYQQDGYHLYIDFHKINGLFHKVFQPELNSSLSWLKDIYKGTGVSLLQAPNGLLLASQKHKQNEEDTYLSFLTNGQHPTPNKLLQWIPNGAAYYFRFGITDGERFGEQAFEQLESISPEARATRERINALGFDLDDFYENILEEIGQVVTYKEQSGEAGLLLLCKVENIQKATDTFQELFEEQKNESAYQKDYRSHTIFSLEMTEVPAALFGKLFKGYPKFYYTFHHNLLVGANSLETIQEWIRSQELQQVWTQQDHFSSIVSDQYGESTFSLAIQTKTAWKNFLSTLTPEWQKKLNLQRRKLLDFEFLSLTINDSTTAFKVTHNTYKQIPLKQKDTPAKVFSKTFHRLLNELILLDHQYILFQDQHNKLICADTKGNQLWAFNLDAPIAEGIHKLHYFGKKEDLITFAAGNKIYAITVSGKMHRGFPLSLPPYIQFEQFMAFKHPKKNEQYCLAAVDGYGQMYITHTDGKFLSGWAPQKLLEPLVTPPHYKEANGKGYLFTLSDKGKVSAFDINGKPIKGFPMQFGIPVSTNGSLQKNDNQLSFGFISDEGAFATVDQDGKVTERLELHEEFPNGYFQMVVDEIEQKKWLLTVQNGKVLKVLNQRGQLIFKVPHLFNHDPIIQYFDFGVDAEVLSFTLPETQLTYLFYINGEPVLDKPLPSNQNIRMEYVSSEKAFKVYTVHKQKLEAYLIPND
ncbi:hypothetical protein V6R21_27865 [Limibacter armeniacum]|uniref:hypothetical protein n=1 Tax=Limibacter armeniacum TaxID=466084 RepID=UPI002FE64610